MDEKSGLMAAMARAKSKKGAMPMGKSKEMPMEEPMAEVPMKMGGPLDPEMVMKPEGEESDMSLTMNGKEITGMEQVIEALLSNPEIMKMVKARLETPAMEAQEEEM